MGTAVLSVGGLPTLLETIGWVFPLRHFTNAAFEASAPATAGWGFAGDHLAVMALWGAAAAVVAVRLLQNAPDDRPRGVGPATPHRAHRRLRLHTPRTSG